jgi:hypothetical protein
VVTPVTLEATLAIVRAPSSWRATIGTISLVWSAFPEVLCVKQLREFEHQVPSVFLAESRWPPTMAVALALLLYLFIPAKFVGGPKWLLPVLEGLLIIPLIVSNPRRITRQSRATRSIGLLLIALINAANFTSIGLLVHGLLHGLKIDGRSLVLATIEIYVTNVLVFALWYWELDGGGPVARLLPEARPRDFRFPQMESPELVEKNWTPKFVDYLYLAFTDSTAFSPTDAMPMTPWAKLLMLAEATAALVTVVIVASRAVGVLS